MAFADVEAVLVAYLTGAFPSVRVCTELPAVLPSETIQVERIGGTDKARVIDVCTVDVEVYAQDRPTANTLAGQVKDALHTGAIGYTALGAVIADVVTTLAPAWKPYDNTNVRRVGGTYQITLHNQQ